MDDPLIADLRQQIANGQAMAIIGAGVSIGATNNASTASWAGLLKDGVARCKAVGNPRPSSGWSDRQRAALDGGDLDDLLGVAEQVSRRLGYPSGGEWRRWLRETFEGLKASERSVLEAVRDLGIPIATTNYDGLIEEVTGWPAVTWRDEARVERVLRGDEEGVLHLHGHWADPASVVLGIRSYDAVLGDTHAQTVLRALRLRQTFVFVGFGAGLDDPNFGELLSWSRAVFSGSEYRHFRLCRSEERDRTQAQHPPDQRIFAVPFGAEHIDLLPFLMKLAPAARTVTQPSRTLVGPIRLPAKAARCIGRDSEVETLVGGLLAHERVPVLGPAGIGKTTICLQALHDPRVAERFGARRYFVRCDAALTAEALLLQVGVALGLEASPSTLAKVVGQLAEAPAALALDNLETPWDQQQLETEEVLKEVSGIENLALVVTLRGLSRPLGVAWRDALQVTPLSGDDPKHLFLAIAGAKHEKDTHLARLLTALDGMPLAIELMAHAAEAEPDLAGVWHRWHTERSEMLKRGKGDQRLLSLAVSLELSMASPRMTDAARRLLAMLSLLPSGIARSEIDFLVPGLGHAAGATLRQVALAFDEAGRLRCLRPIREYVSATHPPSLEDCKALATYHQGKVDDLNESASLAKASLDQAKKSLIKAKESHGIAKMISDTTKKNVVCTKDIKKHIRDAEQHNARARRKLNLNRQQMRIWSEDTIPLFSHLASFFAKTKPQHAALFLKHLAHLYLVVARETEDQGLYKDAQMCADKALIIYRQMGNAQGEAECVKELDDIAKARPELREHGD